MGDKFEELRAALPPWPIDDLHLVKKTKNEMTGPCFRCGGKDRFVLFLDSNRAICRHCSPRGIDLIDYHCWSEDLDVAGLMAKYLEPQKKPKQSRTETGRRTHLYTDEHGTPLYRKIIVQHRGGGKHAFFERHEAGRWVKGLVGIKQTLYNLPGIKTPGPVYLSESEKDADRLIELGFVATAFGGAGSWRAEYAEILAGREVVILAHHDDPGGKAAEKTACDLAAKGCTVKVIPGATWGDFKGADVADWITAGHTREELLALVDAAEIWTPGNAAEKRTDAALKSPQKYNPVDIGTLLSMDLPKRDYILKPVIPEQGLCMVYGLRGGGKTWFVLQLAYVIATGALLFGQWKAPKPRRVLYIDGEMPARTIQKRLASIVAGSEHEPPDPSYLSILTPDLQEAPMPNLATPEGQEAIQTLIEQVEIVIIDNLACLARNGRENDSESWLPVQTWLLGLRRQGKSVVIVHHAGKGGNQRGTSAKEDVLDTVIALRRPDNYDPIQGARFEVHLDKARGVYGPEARPFELQLHSDRGVASWTHRTIEDVNKSRAIELKAEGYSIREIAAEMDISKSMVQRLLKGVEL